MPMYEFKCPECGKVVEELQKYSDKGPNCDKCRAHPEMLKQLSAHAKRDWSPDATKWWT